MVGGWDHASRKQKKAESELYCCKSFVVLIPIRFVLRTETEQSSFRMRPTSEQKCGLAISIWTVSVSIALD